MCNPLMIIGMGLSMFGQIAQANMQAAYQTQMAQRQAEIANMQLEVDIGNERVKSAGETADEMAALNRALSTNVAYLSSRGISQNVSYEQGTEPYIRRVAGTTVGRQQFSSDQVVQRKKYEIAVNKWRRDATIVGAKVEQRGAIIGAVVGGLGSGLAEGAFTA